MLIKAKSHTFSCRGLFRAFSIKFFLIVSLPMLTVLAGCYTPRSVPGIAKQNVVATPGSDDHSCAPGNWDLITDSVLQNLNSSMPESARESLSYKTVNGTSSASFTKEGEYIVCMDLEVVFTTNTGAPTKTSLTMKGLQKGIYSDINKKLNANMAHDGVRKSGMTQIGNLKIPLPEKGDNPFFIVPSTGAIFCPVENELNIVANMSNQTADPVTLRFLRTDRVDCSQCSAESCEQDSTKQLTLANAPTMNTVRCMNAGQSLLLPTDWDLLNRSVTDPQQQEELRQQQVDLIFRRMRERRLLGDWTPRVSYRTELPASIRPHPSGSDHQGITRAVVGETVVYILPGAFDSSRKLLRIADHESRHVIQSRQGGMDFGMDMERVRRGLQNDANREDRSYSRKLHDAAEMDARLFEIENAHLAQLTTQEMRDIRGEIQYYRRTLPSLITEQFDSRLHRIDSFLLSMAREDVDFTHTCRSHSTPDI